MRSVIFHYHLFKNAGTSIDAILKQNFGQRWLNGEFEGKNNQQAVANWIASEANGIAFSSHTAQFPLPSVDGVEIFPIIFLRHPLDRIKSAYQFERRQRDGKNSSALAKQNDLAGYIRGWLKIPRGGQCRNFQTQRLAKLVPGGESSELDRALEALRILPFVGVVERFDASVARLESLLKPAFPEFKRSAVHKNATAGAPEKLADRLAQMRNEIGEDLFGTLMDANMKDLCLHHAATIRFNLDRRRQQQQAAAKKIT